MLKRLFRLTSDKDFQTVYRRGRYQATALFSVNVLPTRFRQTKIGIVVNKKVSKLAVARNNVKRQVREIAREQLSHMKPGQNIVITVRQPALKADYQTMQKDILGSFKRLGVLDGENTAKDN